MNLKIFIYAILSAIIIFILFQLINKPKSNTFLYSINLAGNTYVENRDSIIIYESWQRVSGNTLEGYSVYINKNNNDTIFKEELRIVEMLEEIYYIASVKNNENLVSFKLQNDELTTREKNINEYSFINPKHDYPKFIKYTLKNDSLKIVIGDDIKTSIFNLIKSN